jgi:nucleoside-diphosphate-sugar epimerase
MSAKIGIIGGAGFVGTRLSKRLQLANQVHSIMDINVLSSSEVQFVDVEDPVTLNNLNGIDCIINLAAIHRDDIRPLSRYDDVNVTGAKNICDAARKYKINKIIFTSSVAIYGFAPPGTDESGRINYFNDYGRTKFLAEKVFKDWFDEDPHNRSLVIVRPTVIFGEGNRGNVYNLLKQISSRKFVMFGKGKNIKSMAYVENVAAFLEYCLSFEKGFRVYNYIDKPDFDMNTLVSKVRHILFGKNNIGIRLPSLVGTFIGYSADIFSRITGKRLPVSSIRVKKFMGTTSFNTSINNSGFTPPVCLEDGLRRTLKYEFVYDNSDKRIFETE